MCCDFPRGRITFAEGADQPTRLEERSCAVQDTTLRHRERAAGQEAIQTAARQFGQIAVAVNAAAGIVTLAGLLVLLGTIAALARRRRREATLLKVFGASQSEIPWLYATEFGLAAAVAALLGTAIGVAAAYPVVVFAFEARWSLPWQPAAAVIASARALAATGGAIAGYSALARTPTEVLRTP